MWGPSILVAPKVRKALYKNSKYFFPVSEEDTSKWWSIDVYLPLTQASQDVCWYYYGTKLRGSRNIPAGGFINDMLLENHEYGVFVKGGSIIPVKLHKGALAILRTVLNPIRLDVYLNADRSYAEGLLYMDDGESYRYQTDQERVLIKYTYHNGKLSC